MIYFIINPNSKTGRGAKVWNRTKKLLEEWKVPYQAFLTEYEGHAVLLTRKLCAAHPGKKTIVIVGGDGTVNEVLNGLSSLEQITLGYLPAGSSNDLARAMKLPDDPNKALQRILRPKNFRYLDYGTVLCERIENGSLRKLQRRFLVSAGLGYDAEVCRGALHSGLKQTLNRFGLGKLTYLALAVANIIKNQPADLVIQRESEPPQSLERVFFLAVMNQVCEGGGFQMAPAANPEDGWLDICIVYGRKKWQAALYFPLIYFGLHTKLPGIRMFRCKKLKIHSDKPCMVHTDGELDRKFTEVTVNCINGKLRMIA